MFGALYCWSPNTKRTSAGISEADYVEMLLEHQVSGVIFSGGLYAQAAADHEHYFRLRERGLPAVLVNAAYDDLGFPRISVDDRRAVEQAFTHLRFLGHGRAGSWSRSPPPGRTRPTAQSARRGGVPGRRCGPAKSPAAL